jgi:hypothetical protein
MSSRHGSGDTRRGIAPWIIVTVVTIVVVAAAVVGYVLITRGGDDDAAAACSSEVVLPVVASPGSSAAIAAAAAAFDATNPVARSTCVTTAVTTLPGPDAEQALAGGWTAQSSPAPALWVPDSEADILALESSDSAMTAGRDTDPLATSPVVLAVKTENAEALAAAGVSWKSLPTATGPRGSLKLPSGGQLITALPGPVDNRATSYALQSVVAATSGAPVTEAKVTADAPALKAVAAGGPVPEPALTQDALTELAGGQGGFTTVPVVQSDLTSFSAGTPGLTGVSPSGATVGDAVYVVPLTASWVTPTLDDAAALFATYLRGPEGTAAFTQSGMQVAGGAPASGSATPASAAASATGTAGATPALGTTDPPSLADAGPDIDRALAQAIGAKPAS